MVITLAILSTNCLVRIGLRAAIDAREDIRIIGDAGSLMEVEDLMLRYRPQVFMIDRESEIDTLKLVRTIKASAPASKIVLLTGLENQHHLADVMSAGIDGVVLNVQPPATILATIDHVVSLATGPMAEEPERTGRVSESRVAEKSEHVTFLPPLCPDELTKRQREVVALIAEGLSNKNIADPLCVSSITVRHHLTAIFDKLGVTTRQKLLIRAHQYGLVEFKGLATPISVVG